MGPSHQKDPRTGRDRRGDGAGRARGGAGGAPGAVRNGGVSESVAKASRGGIGGEQKRGISTIRLARPGSIGVFATDLDNRRRRGPLHGRRPRRSPRLPGPARPRPLGAEACTLHSSGAFCPREVRLEVPARVQSARLESRMHISTSTGPTRPHHPGRPQPAPSRADPGPGPRPPVRKAQWAHGGALLLGPPACAWTTYVPLDHLSAVGPPGSRNTVVQRNISGPTAFKWSKQTEGVTTCETASHHAGRTVGARRVRGGRTAPTPRPADPDVARIAPG